MKPTILLYSLLYLLQGMMRGFITIALSVFLIEQGFSHRDVAWLVAIFILPWSFKIFWGPLVDFLSARNSRWQSRLILLSQIGCATALAILSAVDVDSHSLTRISVFVFTASICISLQDVAADSLAMNTLELNDLTIVNSGMRFGRFFGVGMGSFVTAITLSSFGFSITVFLMAITVFIITITSYRLLTLHPSWFHNRSSDDQSKLDLWQTLKCLVLEMKKWPTVSILLFGFLVSIGDSIVEFSIKPLFVDELGWSAVRFSTYDSFGSFLKAGGAVLAATFAIRSAYSPLLLTVSGLAMASALSIVLSLSARLDPRIPVIYILVSPVIASVGWVGFLTLAMQNSKSSFAATKFAILMAACNLGAFFGVLLIGPLKDLLTVGYPEMILAGGLLVLVMSVLFGATTKRNAVVAKNQSQE